MVNSETQAVVSDGELVAADIGRVCQDLVISGKQAVWAHSSAAVILLLLGITGATTFSHVWPVSLILAICSVCRYSVGRKQGSFAHAAWLRAYTIVSVTTTLVWGSFLSYTLLTADEWHTSVALATMLMMTGISAGGLATLAPSWKLHNSFQVGLWGPPLLAAMVPRPNGSGFFLPTIFTIFLAYLLMSGKHYHRKYLTDLRRESDLDRARSAAVSFLNVPPRTYCPLGLYKQFPRLGRDPIFYETHRGSELI